MSKIAIITPFYLPSIGGTQTSLRALSKFFIEKGDRVFLYTSQAMNLDEMDSLKIRPVSNHSLRETVDGVEVHRYPFGGIRAIFSRVLYALSYRMRLPIRRALYNLYKQCSIRSSKMLDDITKDAPHAVLVMPFTEPLAVLALSVRQKTDARLFMHTSLHVETLISGQFVRALRRLITFDGLFVNTEYEREYLIAQGIDRAKIHVTGVGIDIEKVIQPKRQEPVDPVIFKKLAGKKFVLYLGRKEVGKGVEALVSAMEKVNRIFPEVQLVLAGHRSKHFDMKIAPKLAGKKEVNEIEKISESTKQWLFQNASLYCMVSNVDSFGIVYLEAWLNKKPVIGADTGAMRCVITDGQDGLLVPYGDAERLAEQIVYLLQNPDIAGRMGETGCEKVMKKFGNHAVEQKTYDLVHNILTQGT